MKQFLAFPFGLIVLLALSACSNGNGELGLPIPGFAGGEGIEYQVSIEGDISDDLREKLRGSSELVALTGERPNSRAALRRRVDGDLGNFRSVLRAEGYYGGNVDARIQEGDEQTDVVVKIEPGRRYELSEFRIVYTRLGDTLPADAREFGWTPGMPARGEAVVGIQQALVNRLRGSGRPKASIEDREAVVNHDKATMTVTLRVDPGPQAVFGPLSIEGLNKVEEEYARFVADWPEGQTWNQEELDAVRRRLAGTNLFRTIHVHAADSVDNEGRLPTTVVVEESKHRTIAAGINYSTDEQFGGEVSWEHRNLFGRGERLRLSLEGSAVRQEAKADLRKPHFLLRDLTFLANASGRAQETDAFDERTAAGFVGLEKRFAEIWVVGVGASVDYSLIKEDIGKSTYAILGLPLHVGRDGTDDLLNPTEGTRIKFSTTPYFATIEQDVSFTVFETEASAYMGLGKKDQVVPALRVRLGSIIGADTLDIPITKRFFAGGGGSVRGYEYQKAGPLDADGDPVGGRSVFETGFELRWRVTDSVGIVPFVDGGNVYDATTPDFSEDLFWAAGLGFRYYTIAGPIRLDVAFPLNGRDGIDDDFQIYVSLGQAF